MARTRAAQLEFDVPVVGEVPHGLPPLQLPSVAWASDSDTLYLMARPACTVGIFSYMISMSIVRTMAIKFGYKIDANKEL